MKSGVNQVNNTFNKIVHLDYNNVNNYANINTNHMNDLSNFELSKIIFEVI